MPGAATSPRTSTSASPGSGAKRGATKRGSSGGGKSSQDEGSKNNNNKRGRKGDPNKHASSPSSPKKRTLDAWVVRKSLASAPIPSSRRAPLLSLSPDVPIEKAVGAAAAAETSSTVVVGKRSSRLTKTTAVVELDGSLPPFLRPASRGGAPASNGRVTGKRQATAGGRNVAAAVTPLGSSPASGNGNALSSPGLVVAAGASNSSSSSSSDSTEKKHQRVDGGGRSKSPSAPGKNAKNNSSKAAAATTGGAAKKIKPPASAKKTNKAETAGATAPGRGAVKGSETFTRRGVKANATTSPTVKPRKVNVNGGASYDTTTEAAGTASPGRRRAPPRSGKAPVEAASARRFPAGNGTNPPLANEGKGVVVASTTTATDSRAGAAPPTPPPPGSPVPPRRDSSRIGAGNSSPAGPSSPSLAVATARLPVMPRTPVRGAAAVAAAAAAAAAASGSRPAPAAPATAASAVGAKKTSAAPKSKKSKPTAATKKPRHSVALVVGPGGGSGWAKRGDVSSSSSKKGKTAEQQRGSVEVKAESGAVTVTSAGAKGAASGGPSAMVGEVAVKVAGAAGAAGPAGAASCAGGAASAVALAVGASTAAVQDVAPAAAPAAAVTEERSVGEMKLANNPSKRPLPEAGIVAEDSDTATVPPTATGGGGAKAVEGTIPAAKKHKSQGAEAASSNAADEAIKDWAGRAGAAGTAAPPVVLAAVPATSGPPHGSQVARELVMGPAGSSSSSTPTANNKRKIPPAAVEGEDQGTIAQCSSEEPGKNDDGCMLTAAAVVVTVSSGGGGDSPTKKSRATEKAPSPTNFDDPPLAAGQTGAATSGSVDVLPESNSSTANNTGAHETGSHGCEPVGVGGGAAKGAWARTGAEGSTAVAGEAATVVEARVPASLPEEEVDTHVMRGGVMQVRCRHCKSRLGRAGCSTRSCLDCCFKAARPCAAHAKQLDRKRLEEELLAAGPSQSQLREEQRNIKGLFKEDAFHAIGDTATVWCFVDFLCAKSNQAAFTALSRTQRATAGRQAPRTPRRCSGGGGGRGAAAGRRGSGGRGIAPTTTPLSSATTATTTPASGAGGGEAVDTAAAATASAAAGMSGRKVRRVIRPALARWRRKNTQMLAALSLAEKD